MNLFQLVRFFSVLFFLVCATSISLAKGSWDRASSCFNNADFECAFAEAKQLARDGRIAVGNGRKTTDSMTFYQMAMVEYLSSADYKEKTKAAEFTLKVFARYKSRLPFPVAFGFLSIKHDYVVETNIDVSELDRVLCDILKETPPPSWRKLIDTNPLSAKGKTYFRRVMQVKPPCVSPAHFRTPSQN